MEVFRFLILKMSSFGENEKSLKSFGEHEKKVFRVLVIMNVFRVW